MEFRTELKVQKSGWELQHGHIFLSVGSCFADFIGNKLEDNQFEVLSNPFGTVYNPLSICDNLRSCLEQTLYSDLRIAPSRGLFFSYKLHSQIFAEFPTELQAKMGRIQDSVRENLVRADFLIITLGSAIIYELNSDSFAVANCHKMPSQTFKKRLLEVSEIVDGFSELITYVLKFNSKLKIIATVSPVRHVKDTLVLNSISKSSLLLAAYKLGQLFPANVQYFPAFELVADDLRDYRFYKEDLIHPNEMAQRYIWEKFGEVYFSDRTRLILKEIQSVYSAVEHEILHPNTKEYELFKKNIVEKVSNLNAQVPIPRLIEKVNLKFK